MNITYRKRSGSIYTDEWKSSNEDPKNVMSEALRKAGFQPSDNQFYRPLEIFEAVEEFCGDVGIDCNTCRTNFPDVSTYCGSTDGNPVFENTNRDFKFKAGKKLEKFKYLPREESRHDQIWYIRILKSPVLRIPESKLYQKALKELTKDTGLNKSKILEWVRKQKHISGFLP